MLTLQRKEVEAKAHLIAIGASLINFGERESEEKLDLSFSALFLKTNTLRITDLFFCDKK